MEKLFILQSGEDILDVLQVKNHSDRFDTDLELAIQKWHESDEEFDTTVLQALKNKGWDVEALSCPMQYDYIHAM